MKIHMTLHSPFGPVPAVMDHGLLWLGASFFQNMWPTLDTSLLVPDDDSCDLDVMSIDGSRYYYSGFIQESFEESDAHLYRKDEFISWLSDVIDGLEINASMESDISELSFINDCQKDIIVELEDTIRSLKIKMNTLAKMLQEDM